MKTMEMSTSGWTDEMRQNAISKLENLGYKLAREEYRESENAVGLMSITTFRDGDYVLYDVTDCVLPFEQIGYNRLMAMTKEDVK